LKQVFTLPNGISLHLASLMLVDAEYLFQLKLIRVRTASDSPAFLCQPQSLYPPPQFAPMQTLAPSSLEEYAVRATQRFHDRSKRRLNSELEELEHQLDLADLARVQIGLQPAFRPQPPQQFGFPPTKRQRVQDFKHIDYDDFEL